MLNVGDAARKGFPHLWKRHTLLTVWCQAVNSRGKFDSAGGVEEA